MSDTLIDNCLVGDPHGHVALRMDHANCAEASFANAGLVEGNPRSPGNVSTVWFEITNMIAEEEVLRVNMFCWLWGYL